MLDIVFGFLLFILVLSALGYFVKQDTKDTTLQIIGQLEEKEKRIKELEEELEEVKTE